MKTHNVHLIPDDISLTVGHEQLLIEAMIEADLFLRTDCGGKGRCGKCRVKIPGGGSTLSPPGDEEVKLLGVEDLRAGYRLACLAKIIGDVEVEIPESSRLSPEVTRKGEVQLPPGIGRAEATGYALAVDLGTTTVAVYLCDLAGGRVQGSISVKNPQALFGDDVMSRIGAASGNPHNRVRLQSLVIRAVDWAIGALCRTNKIAPDSLSKMVVVGNTTMIHLFVGEDVASIGVHPYSPVFVDEKNLRADELGFRFNPSAEIITLPLISGFLGSDIVAAALAADLYSAPEGTVVVDVGTNGEVICRDRNGFTATSCATGPALEGATIRHGMQAFSGAIDRIRVRPGGDLSCSVIRKNGRMNPKPSGICGSGIISAVAELLRNDMLKPDGRFNSDAGFPALQPGERGIPELILVRPENSQTGRAITLTQKDIRAVQLAKGALRTGIDLLCLETGRSRPQKLQIAGAFGSFIRESDARTLGLFPEPQSEDFEVIGNAAGAGAMLALFDDSYRSQAERLARETRVLDLASHPDFQQSFVSALSFPATT